MIPLSKPSPLDQLLYYLFHNIPARTARGQQSLVYHSDETVRHYENALTGAVRGAVPLRSGLSTIIVRNVRERD